MFGSSKAHRTLRRILVEEQKLDAIVSMPSGVFRPYAGVSTAILLFTKTNSGGTDDVWFYDMQADGYSLGRQAHAANRRTATLLTSAPAGGIARRSVSGDGRNRVFWCPRPKSRATTTTSRSTATRRWSTDVVHYDPPGDDPGPSSGARGGDRSRTRGTGQVALMKWHAHAIGEVAQVNPKLAAADRPDLYDKVSFVPMASVSEETMSIAVHKERPSPRFPRGTRRSSAVTSWSPR